MSNRVLILGMIAALMMGAPERSIGQFGIRLVELDGNEWSLQVERDSTWHHFDIPLSMFGSGGGFLNTPVTRVVLVPVGGSSLGGVIFEVADWIDQIVLANTVIDDCNDTSFSDWEVNIALNGSYLGLASDSNTPDGSSRCMQMLHGCTMDFAPFVGWMEKTLGGLTLTPADTLSFWLRGFGYMVTDVKEDQRGTPERFEMKQNYPNPFNPTTSIKFKVPSSKVVTLKVFDMLGREVATLVNEPKEPGVHTAQWDASGLGSGVYFYTLKAGDFVQTRKMILQK